MARFKRDEQRTYPIWWLIAGGLFAFSSAWACYAEFVTRVPWQKEQEAFFRMEYDLANQNLKRVKNEYAATVEPQVKKLKARSDELKHEQATGKYSTAKSKLTQLSQDFANAEQDKTFGKSDLDEAYYYRQLAEYKRDAAEEKARQELEGADHENGRKRADEMLADPPPLAPKAGVSSDMRHLEEEIARNSKRAEQIDKAFGSLPGKVKEAWDAAREAERAVATAVRTEVEHQKRIDKAVEAMTRIDGPSDPASSERDEKIQQKLRADVCGSAEAKQTRHCIQWIELDPVDSELAVLERGIAKGERPVEDAKLRLSKADERSRPALDPKNLIKSLVGPYQIEQVVTHWQDAEADVDREAVDRCMTCHMGVDSASYTEAKLPRQFRTHPFRKTLFSAHPVEKFGCTPCHQGQGRATDALAHSRERLVEASVTGPRWVHEGDEFWEDVLYPVGQLRHIVIDDDNDSFQIKIGGGAWKTIEIPHRGPEVVNAKEAEARANGKALSAKKRKGLGDYVNETQFFGTLQELVSEALEPDDAKAWHVVVRKANNRVEIGVEQNDPVQVINPIYGPKVKLKFPKPGLAELLGFVGVTEIESNLAVHTGGGPPAVPVRSEAQESWDKNGRYTPPTARKGLQLVPEYRDRFIQSIPEVESGCLRCHQGDVDLRPHTSKAKFVLSKLERQKAEAEKARDAEAYRKAHRGSDELPEVLPNPADDADPVPLLTEGRYLFKKLNCTGCHILDGFTGNRNAGPQLNDITAKVTPEWMLKWVRYPRAWRHKTRMPNFWPAPLDPASKLPYPEGSPEYVKWEASMKEESLAIASFLMERSEHPETRPGAKGSERPLGSSIKGYGAVDGANAEQGQRFFDAYGCRGCHVTSEEKAPAPFKIRERDVAPSLANAGSKMNADWLTYWVEDPSRYWHDTRMPKLRLSRVEAASIAQYLLTLKDEPKDAAGVGADEAAMLSSAAKRKEKITCNVVGPGATLERDKCGEKLVAYYGCFGCHNIAGFENYAPIAPELSGWAKKDVTKLDYGYAIDDHHQQTHETFFTWKVDSPRIYRRDRIELRMADFDLSPREIRALTVFVMGLVESKPLPEYAPAARPEYASILEGRQLVDDYNCRGCHVIEDRGGDFAAAVKVEHQQNAPPYLAGEGMRVQPEWLFNFVRDPQKNAIRPFLHPEWVYGEGEVPGEKLQVRMPTFPFSSEQTTAIVRYFASWDGQEYPYIASHTNAPTTDQKLFVATHMNSAQHANCMSCHFVGEFPTQRGKDDLQKMAPNLGNVSKRLRPEWVKAWLSAPMNWLPYTKMLTLWSDAYGPPLAWDKAPLVPAPKSGEDQVEVVRDFLFTLTPDSVWPKPGEEGKSPVVQGGPSPERGPSAESEKGAKGKGKKNEKNEPKKHGMLERRGGTTG
ncbi:MAG TPA: c-type cytochrome [Polyangiaceae bacterium]|nr:c-type cytochrome [Polyangiaceae bacterium]